MTSPRVKNELNSGIYFLTCSVKNLYYIFDRHNRWDILLQSLKYFQQEKGLKIYAWVFMLNHIHLLVERNDVSGFLRDFKKFTSKKLKESILAHEPTVLKIFQEDENFHFWENTNMPQKIETMHFFKQKYNYIHDNPVRKRYVKNKEDWLYSSAHPKQLLFLSYLEKES